MTIDDLDRAYQAAETELRAFQRELAAKYAGPLPGSGPQDPDGEACDTAEQEWSGSERERMARLRDEAADAALALLDAQGWFDPRCPD